MSPLHQDIVPNAGGGIGPNPAFKLAASYGMTASRYVRHTEETHIQAQRDGMTFLYDEQSGFERLDFYSSEGRLEGDWMPGRIGDARSIPDFQSPARNALRPRFVDRRSSAGPERDQLHEQDRDPQSLLDPMELKRVIFERLFGITFQDRFDPAEFQKSLDEAARRSSDIQGAYQGGAINSDDFYFEATQSSTTEVREVFEFGVRLEAYHQDENGNSISQAVDVRIRVSREYVEQTRLSMQIGEKKDPLVLDLSNEGIDLSGVENGTIFDLDGDGAEETTAMARGQTGLLWMDRNGDDQLSNGTELFGDFRGAQNGFEDLGKLDRNGDGKIDIGDIDFEELRLRFYNNGRVYDQSLKEAGVKTLYLDNMKLPAEFGASASLDSIGVYQREDGSFGAMADVLLAREA